MSKTGIQWTDETWNPVTGCDKISQGCKNCYAETLHTQRHKFNERKAVELTSYSDPSEAIAAVRADEDLDRYTSELQPRTYDTPFTTVVCHTERLREPLGWRKAKRVFTCSMGDLFHEDVPDAFLDQVFAVMALTPHITYQVLTKRPERMREYVGGSVKERWFAAAKDMADSGEMTELNRRAWVPNGEPFEDATGQTRVPYTTVFHRFPLPNVWLGTSVENQEAADQRIPELLATPAAVRFLSCEPLLGPVDLGFYLAHIGLHWVIVGGESGAGARPCDIEWVRDIVRKCRAAGVAPFVKQLGSKPAMPLADWRAILPGRVSLLPTLGDYSKLRLKHGHGGNTEEWPEDMRVREFPVVAP